MRVRNTWHALLIASAIGAIAVSTGLTVSAQGGGTARWAFGGGDLGNTRNAAGEKKITTANVSTLTPKWVFPTHGELSATPTVETNGAGGTTIYAVDWAGYVYSINDSGTPNWSRKLSDFTGNPNGTVARTSPAIVGNTIIVGDQGDVDSGGFSHYGATASVMAINKSTGALVWRKVVSDHPFSVVTSSPVSYNGTVYVGVASLEENAGFIPGYIFSWRGKVVALDAKTGANRWASPFVTIDNAAYALGYTGASVWGSTPVVDQARNSLYVTTGNNYSGAPSGCATTAACIAQGTPAGNRIDSVIALDLAAGTMKWSYRAQPYDTWDVARWVNNSYVTPGQDATIGPDYDFASGANLFTASNGQQYLGAGEKSGQYHVLNPDSGALVWKTQAGVGGTGGGIEWGSAVDGTRIYTAIANSDSNANGYGTTGGLWTALDAVSGAPLWTTLDPIIDTTPGFPRWGHDFGMVTVANGVVFASSTGGAPIPGYAPGFAGGFFALDAATGQILWSFTSAQDSTIGSVNSGAAVVDGVVYWGGGGYSHLGNAFGIGGTPKLYAFTVGKK